MRIATRRRGLPLARTFCAIPAWFQGHDLWQSYESEVPVAVEYDDFRLRRVDQRVVGVLHLKGVAVGCLNHKRTKRLLSKHFPK